MQKKLLGILLLIWIAFQGEAQHFQVSGYAGYATPSFLRVTNGEYHIAGNISTGVKAAVTKKELKGFTKNTFLEIQYNFQPTTFRYEVYNSDIKYDLRDMNIYTMLVGLLQELNEGTVKFFGSLLMGLTVYDPEVYINLTRFTLSIAAGANIPVSAVVGFHLQAQLMMPVMYDEVYVGWEPGFGLTTGVAANGLVFAPQFAGGFYFNLGMVK